MATLLIGGVSVKLVAEKMMYFPKNVRSFPLAVTVDGAPSEFRLTTGRGRDGSIRRYAHLMVDGKAMWCLLPDAVILIDVEAKKVAAIPTAAEKDEAEAAAELAESE